MSDSSKPLVYLILGAAGSGRRELLVDLIQDGLVETDRGAVMLAAGETADAEFDAKLPRVTRWEWQEKTIIGAWPAEATHVFFVTDGRRDPVDQIEAFKAWVPTQGGELARVICIVNTQLAEKHPALLAWYEACVHFSDVVLLNKREGVANKWMSDFVTHFKKLYVPSVFEMVKDGQVKNPALVLEPQARRMSHFLDEEQDWIFTNSEGDVIDEQEETPDGEEEIEAKPEEDPYLVLDAAGRRVKRLPDVAKYL
ncbi:hypothetical protein [Horticoccus sp. 23ND18S-11]|uniref:hypothetical protein n=1 Tax=Horticoccus sp. 23ND18S-11 TaxID=3391832 RepID=UPI0039C908D3